jgi:hypothetical protein
MASLRYTGAKPLMPTKPASSLTSGGQRLPLDAEGRAQMKRWLDQWKRSGTVLDAQRLEELRGLDDIEAARIACDIVWPMGTLGDPGGDDAAGIVPMQAVLWKLAASK